MIRLLIVHLRLRLALASSLQTSESIRSNELLRVRSLLLTERSKQREQVVLARAADDVVVHALERLGDPAERRQEVQHLLQQVFRDEVTVVLDASSACALVFDVLRHGLVGNDFICDAAVDVLRESRNRRSWCSNDVLFEASLDCPDDFRASMSFCLFWPRLSRRLTGWQESPFWDVFRV